MKKLHGIIVCLIVGLLVGAPVDGQGRALSAKNRTSIRCSMEKMRIMAEFFDVHLANDKKEYELPAECGGGRVRKVSMPKWFADELTRMDANKVVYVPNEGTYSEVDLWRQAFSNVYLFLDRADKSLDPNQPIVLDQLSRGYVGNRINLMATLDRLNKDLLRGKQLLVMKDSMEGRARSMLSTFELINNEFFSTIESFSSPISQREDKYRKSVMAVVVLANHLFSQFMSSPIPGSVPDPKIYRTTPADRATSLFMIVLGSALAGLAVFLLLENKKENILVFLEDYKQKSSAWAEDFNRQFVTIDIKYIVFGTIAFFALGGLLMGLIAGGFLGVFIFLLVLFLGGVISIRMPMAVLDALKKSRGRKVNAQLMDSLILLSNSLRSGMDIVQGFELVSRDMLPPIADEFGLVVKNYQLGTPFEKALDGLTERVDSRMLSYIVKAIIIQRQVGGNLTVIFSRLVENIREESKLEEKLQAMTAQQKIQSIVVSIMPFVMMLVMFIFNPSQMFSFYTSPLGICVFLFCIIWIGIGMKILKKMGEVRV
ncbi:type II secretion system F family protein [Candidatus Avelusimicrobium caledoniensis]|uniref:type II secretion system F family protein n=1 Tax=Candidatus Avelusimicrobium caledoniensis TaxID=3416220 RepID=UPI003D0DAD34